MNVLGTDSRLTKDQKREIYLRLTKDNGGSNSHAQYLTSEQTSDCIIEQWIWNFHHWLKKVKRYRLGQVACVWGWLEDINTH